jgi:hypothetical protein
MVKLVKPEGVAPAVMLVRGSAAEFEMATSSQKGTFWMAAKYCPETHVGAGGAA